MKVWASLLFIVGIGATIYAFAMTTTVSAQAEAVAAVPAFANGISNAALMQQQMMILHTGLVVLLIGSIFYVAAEINEAMNREEEE